MYRICVTYVWHVRDTCVTHNNPVLHSLVRHICVTYMWHVCGIYVGHIISLYGIRICDIYVSHACDMCVACVTYNNLVWYSYIWHTCITFICHIHVAYMRHLISCQACSYMSHIYVDWIYRMCMPSYEGIYDNLYFIRTYMFTKRLHIWNMYDIYWHTRSEYVAYMCHICLFRMGSLIRCMKPYSAKGIQ